MPTDGDASGALHRPIAEATPLPGPQIYYFAEPGGEPLLALLRRPGVLGALAAAGHGVAVSLDRLDAPRAAAVRLLNDAGVPAVAWLALPPEEGRTLNLQNYPRAVAGYAAFRSWALDHDLRFEAVGLDIEPPLGDMAHGGWHALRATAGRLWLARDNALYPSARAALVELVNTVRQDGYEVHTYQLPLIADDRRAGTTIVQRALDIAELPADVEVLVCSSGVPIDWLDFDLGGALVDAYGPAADALAVGIDEDEPPAKAWPALRRDLLLAARHTDTLYVSTLDLCARHGLIERVAALDWDAPARPAPLRRVAVAGLRTGLLAALIAGRSWRGALAWSGWLVALIVWLRARRRR